MKQTTPFTVLVNSSDGFDDCWAPFFQLYERYWPQADFPILLNTEAKDYTHPRLPVRATRVQPPDRPRLTWSECLKAALDQIETPLVLYFQEDYFLDCPVDDTTIRKAAGYMLRHEDVVCVQLTGIGSEGPHLQHEESWLQSVRQAARYRLSTQAALWRVSALKSYIVPSENGWMFEICGTWRARKRKTEKFLVVTPDVSSKKWPLSYLHTGIVKGQWLPGIEHVFRHNGIQVDYQRRGFYREKSPIARRWETARKLMSNPVHVARQWW